MVTFKKENRELCYVAARHENSIRSSTFQLVEGTFDSFAPQILILEGFYYACGKSPPWLLDSLKGEEGKAHWKGGEVHFAAFLAHKKGIDFVGAEPEDREILTQLQSIGFTVEDFCFFYFLRNIPQYFRSKELSSEDQLQSLFERDMQRWKEHGLLQSIPTYSDYQEWFFRNASSRVSFKKLVKHDLTVPELDSQLFLHQLSREIESIRDTHILKVQLDLFQEFNKIMVVYGASHYPCQKEVLQRYFGDPVYLRGISSWWPFRKKAKTAKEFFKSYQRSKIFLV